MKRELYSELRTIYETTDADPHTFRITIKLKDIVDGTVLRNAVDLTMKRYPYFCVRLCAEEGKLFFEDNPAPVPVLHSRERTVLGSEELDGHLLAFSYWKNRLYLDAYHGLTDGGGIDPLIRTLLYYYLTSFYETELSAERIRLSDSPVSPDEWDDPAGHEIPAGRRLLPKWNQEGFQLEEGGIVYLTPDSVVYNIRIPEEEFMRFNISNDGSPAAIAALLLAETIDALHPEAGAPPVIAMCVNQRKALQAPAAHQSLVGDVRLPYIRRMRHLPFSTRTTCFRGMVTIQTDNDMILEDIREYQELVRYLKTLETYSERKAYCTEQMRRLSGCVTAIVSYVGKAGFGDLEQYIQEYEALPSTALPSMHVPLTIEMSALHGYFFLNFIQYFAEEDYVSMFIRKLRENNITYDVLNEAQARFPRVELPI